MRNERSVWFARAIAICVLAVAVNFLLVLLRYSFQQPLFLGNMPFAAVAFVLGPVAGIAVVAASWVARGLYFGFFSLFVIVSVIEVLIIGTLRPMPRAEVRSASLANDRVVAAAYTFGRLFILYIVCVLAVSVSGGIISTLVYGPALPYETEIDALKLGLQVDPMPPLLASILSRVLVNLADRFLVVFGGYGVSMLCRKWLYRTKARQ